MSLDKKERSKTRQLISTGAVLSSNELDGTTTEEVINLGIAASKVSYQSTKTLAGNISFSINGKDFFDSTAFTATVQASYITHNVVAVKVSRTGGTGRMVISAS
jgi:hypothetical protein